MKSWDSIWEKMISDLKFKEQYHQTFLLNLFQKMCSKMNKDEKYKTHINKLLKQSYNQIDTIRNIAIKEYELEISEYDAQLLLKWLDAYRRKKDTRKTIKLEEKKSLIDKQRGLCMVCQENLGSDYSKIHIDHIIPWILVGDELENNYQALCSVCNECKNAKIDYLFMNLLNLT